MKNKEEHGHVLHFNGWGRAAPGQNLRLRVRPASPLDIPAVADLLGRLSERSRLLRYFTARPFTPETARRESGRIVQRGAAQGFTLLGTIGEGDVEAVVAVAELARDRARPHVGELAVVVRDDQQARGAGHLLTSRLIEIAFLHGVTTLRATVLHENKAMLRLLRGLGVPHRSWYEAGDVQVELSLDQHVGLPPHQAL